MKCKHIFLSVLLSVAALSASAQVPPVCPPNIDFELGNLSNWFFFAGTVATGPVYTLTSTPAIPGRHDLTFGPGLDPYGFFPVVSPTGNYSLKLGNNLTGAECERARYYLHVPSTSFNYSINYWYAVVLQDPIHSAPDQPRFVVTAYDSATGAPIPCAQYNYVAGKLPGFLPGPSSVWYKTWSLGSMDLSGAGGKTVIIDFTSADCTLGGHFGYGYIDMNCGIFGITNLSCNADSVKLMAPGGFSIYSWYDSLTFTHLYGTGDTITIATPPSPTTYAVILTPYAGFGCIDTLYTRVFPTRLATDPSNDTTVCLGTSLTLHMRATDIALPLTYMWWGGSGTMACPTCDSTLITPGIGDSWYKYSVTDQAGCQVVDSIKVHATGVIPVISSTDVSCHGLKDGTAGAMPISGNPPFTYSWSTVPAQTTSVAVGLSAGTYTVNITESTGCTTHTSATISEPPPTVMAILGSSDPTTCGGNNGSITIGGLWPSVTFNFRYLFNGSAVLVSKLSSPSGQVVFTGLSAGKYDSFTVSVVKCPWNEVGPVTLKDPPKPPPPPVTPQNPCQFDAPKPLVSSGSNLLWYGPGVTAAYPAAPVPPTLVPGITYYYVTQTVAGCVSDSTLDSVVVRAKPAAPLTSDTVYCQFVDAPSLVAVGHDLKWYQGKTDVTELSYIPVPPTKVPGDSTWYVNQTVNGCPSDKSPLTVTIRYKPNFVITPERPWVCQYDSIWLAYDGPALFDPAYIWTIPGAEAYSTNKKALGEGVKSAANDSMIYVRFDSVIQNNYIRLFASDYSGMCSFDTFIRINIIPHPTATSLTKHDVCIGDTVSLALSSKSDNAAVFHWTVDNVPMENSSAMTIIAHNSTSGGPMSISWVDSGRHVIQVFPKTAEGCLAPPREDTIAVHAIPDASFKYVTKNGPLCLEDSILFVANATDFNYSYSWAPEHFFHNINKAATYGKVEQSRSFITLTVTDPFGCAGSNTQEIDPSSCCTVSLPTAFTPNGDRNNDFFRPLYAGYHRFHEFRIVNRWGQVVFNSTNNKMQWDGTYNGVPQDMGVYFYYLKYDCGGETREQKGDVTLIR